MKPEIDSIYTSLICTAMDELFISKARPVLIDSHKRVWLKFLKDQDPRAILGAIESLIYSENNFPDVAAVLRGCANWKRENVRFLSNESFEDTCKLVGVDISKLTRKELT